MTHAGSVAQLEEDIIAEGAEIIWVLEQSQSFSPGTAALCRDFMDGRGSDKGWCVGDSETQPTPGAWDSSPFASGRGIDVIVTRSDMVVRFVADHGTPTGNDNLSGQAILDAVRQVVADHSGP